MNSTMNKSRARLGAVLAQLLPAVFLCLLFVAVGVIHVTSRVQVVHTGYRLSALENDGRLLTRENDRLKLELATLRSAARLERIARGKLGLVPPPAGSVIALSSPKARPRALEGSAASEDSAAAPDRPEAKPTPVRIVNRGLR
jgi:cell division protein FtsL